MWVAGAVTGDDLIQNEIVPFDGGAVVVHDNGRCCSKVTVIAHGENLL